MNDGIKRIAYGYTRVSTEEQTFGASLENQRLAIQKYANQNNIEIVGWYTDAGISAKTAHRPQLQKMLTDIAKHKGRIDHVVVYNVSRISRDMTSFFNDIGFIMAKGKMRSHLALHAGSNRRIADWPLHAQYRAFGAPIR